MASVRLPAIRPVRINTEKAKLWQLLDAERAAVFDRVVCDGHSTAAVSGWYFAHPDAHYFAIGKIARDQVEDYAQRQGVSVPEMERMGGGGRLRPGTAVTQAPYDP